MRIVRLANFVAPRSGGLRTALRHLGEGYAAAGHEPVLVVPGPAPADEDTPQGRVITVPGPVVPWTGGYRVMTGRRSLARLLDRLEPDRLEVSDRTTLRWTGAWARRRGVGTMMVSHESLAGLLRLVRPRVLPTRHLADRLNRATAASYDVVACTTEWAAAEFRRLKAPNLVRLPLGVDLEVFSLSRYDPALRAELDAGPGVALLVHCGRLSVEKRPARSVEALAELRRRGVPAVLAVAGDGPLRPALEARAAGLPVRFLGHIADRAELARLLAGADLAFAPGPVETFGLAALEALACGTPVVACRDSALPEVLGDAGLAVPDDPAAYADAAERVLALPEPARRAAARARAECFGWSRAVHAFLRAHGAAT
ncbi:alpha-1,6-mannosyltransferase [Thermocatellispora tengchongensis]|uniref:Alpha-1,6-mannosyltransferase n=1 Tax=Thermocatellispora tengchongensis TaxID=1073253 RepID=A0A840PCT3_9ACTN|nr:glycosyltransferase [Thermocatellispora tengchongensis]MBB5139224.1 alpha-1,6-mannosyltransferase [Thermocatellispora tengchongensis]